MLRLRCLTYTNIENKNSPQTSFFIHHLQSYSHDTLFFACSRTQRPGIAISGLYDIPCPLYSCGSGRGFIQQNITDMDALSGQLYTGKG